MMTTYAEASLLRALSGGGNSFAMGHVYLGLFTARPTEAGTGPEPTDPMYARQQIMLTAPQKEGTGSFSTNQDQAVFSEAASRWGKVMYYGLFDSPTGGDLYLFGELTEPVDIAMGDVLCIPAGALRIEVA